MQTEFNFIGFLIVVALIALIVNVIILLWYVSEMASKNGRSVFYWVVFSLFITPIISIVLLFCIGETDAKRRERLLKDDELLKMIRKSQEV